MAGEPTPHEVVPYFFSDLADWASLEYVGVGGGWNEEVLRGTFDDGAFSVWYLRDGRLVGTLTVDRAEELDPAPALLREGVDLSAFRVDLCDPDADLVALASELPAAMVKRSISLFFTSPSPTTH